MKGKTRRLADGVYLEHRSRKPHHEASKVRIGGWLTALLNTNNNEHLNNSNRNTTHL